MTMPRLDDGTRTPPHGDALLPRRQFWPPFLGLTPTMLEQLEEERRLLHELFEDVAVLAYEQARRCC